MKKQSRGFGSMLSFNMAKKEFAYRFLEKIRLIKFAESLGGVETLATYPITQTHAEVPIDELARNGITDCTLRLSVGIENVEDLIAEMETVFAEIGRENG